MKVETYHVGWQWREAWERIRETGAVRARRYASARYKAPGVEIRLVGPADRIGDFEIEYDLHLEPRAKHQTVPWRGGTMLRGAYEAMGK